MSATSVRQEQEPNEGWRDSTALYQLLGSSPSTYIFCPDHSGKIPECRAKKKHRTLLRVAQKLEVKKKESDVRHQLNCQEFYYDV